MMDILKITKEDAKEIFKKYSYRFDGDYDFVGIRVQEQPFELGKIEHASKVWDDGEETDEELDGICVIDANDYNEPSYFGYHIAVICGDEAEHGNDRGELIISDPVVVEILK